jgi:hypothetical protein
MWSFFGKFSKSRIKQMSRERWTLFAKTSAFLAWPGRAGGGAAPTPAAQLHFSTASFRLKAEMGKASDRGMGDRGIFKKAEMLKH